MCIDHIPDFAHLEIHKNHREWYIDLKLSGVIISESFTSICHFRWILQVAKVEKIRCVNYACFPKSSHICIVSYIAIYGKHQKYVYSSIY